MRQTTVRPPTSHRQTGIALVAVLLILLIVTLLGVSASRNATQGELIARASRAHQIAFQAAESALAEAKADIGLHATGVKEVFADSVNDDILASVDACGGEEGIAGKTSWANRPTPVWKDPAQASNWTKRGQRAGFAGGGTSTELPSSGVAGVAKQPEYIIEQMSPTECTPTSVFYFRITAKGYGPSDATEVLAQEVVAKQGSFGTHTYSN